MWEIADIIERLEHMGYEVQPSDEALLSYIMSAVAQEVRNYLSRKEIPEELRYVVADMIVGKFLLTKKGTGQLEEFDVAGAVKSQREGDTTVTYAVADDSVTLDGFIELLINGQREQLNLFRRFQWP